MTESTKAKRTRDLGRIVVQECSLTDHVWSDVAPDGVFSTTDDARRWVNDNGVSGRVYRVARVYPAVSVTVEQVPKRTIAEV